MSNQKIFAAACAAVLLTISHASHCDLLDELVSYWKFDGNAVDESGNGNDGTVNGATLTTGVTGIPNTAYAFDGANDYINIGAGTQVPFPFTVGLWIKPATTSFGSVFANDASRCNSFDRNGVELFANSRPGNNVYEGSGCSPSNRRSYTTTDAVLRPGEWQHYAVVFNSLNDRVIYWDGAAVPGSYDGSGNSLGYGGLDGIIGGNPYNPGTWFEGDIDNVTVHNRALSSVEIIELLDFGLAVLDTDLDTIPDEEDNCILVPNPSQLDTDSDGIGNYCDGDFSQDCVVNFFDLVIFRAFFPLQGNFVTDMNGDGVTNFGDLALYGQSFLLPPGPSALPNVCDGG